MHGGLSDTLPPWTLLLPQVPTAITEMDISVKRVRAAAPSRASLLPSPARSLLEHCLCGWKPWSRRWAALRGPALRGLGVQLGFPCVEPVGSGRP